MDAELGPGVINKHAQKVHSPNFLRKISVSDVVRIGNRIIFHLSKR